MTRQPTKDLLVEIDGAGIEPHTVDPVLMMRLSVACFQLLLKVADAMKAPFTLKGLAIHDGCIGVGAVPSNRANAGRAVARAAKVIAGSGAPPSGSVGDLEEVYRCLRALPDGASALLFWDGVEHDISAPAAPTNEAPWEITELRATPIRVGGRETKVTLWSDSEQAEFVLSVTKENARKLGGLLYTEVDVAVQIARDFEGKIEAGKVIEVFELTDGGPEVWREWFAPHAAEWALVDDVEAELGRD